MSNNPVASILKQALADSYALYLKTQNFHWNVVGPHFRSLHLTFEEQYTDLQTAIDVLAERIRALGEKSPGGFKSFQKLTSISDGDEETDAEDMVAILRDDNQTVVRTLKEALQACDKHGDDATADFLTERIQQHEKNAWMLASTLGEEVTVRRKKKG